MVFQKIFNVFREIERFKQAFSRAFPRLLVAILVASEKLRAGQLPNARIIWAANLTIRQALPSVPTSLWNNRNAHAARHRRLVRLRLSSRTCHDALDHVIILTWWCQQLWNRQAGSLMQQSQRWNDVKKDVAGRAHYNAETSRCWLLQYAPPIAMWYFILLSSSQRWSSTVFLSVLFVNIATFCQSQNHRI